MSEQRVVSGNASRFKLAEHQRNIYQYIAEPGTNLETLVKPEYWAHIAARLRPMDRIEIIVEDYSLFTEVMVMDAGRNWAKVMVVRDPLDVSGGPSVTAIEGDVAPFEAQWSGPKTKWRVIRKADKSVLKDGFESRDGAEKWLVDYRRAIAA